MSKPPFLAPLFALVVTLALACGAQAAAVYSSAASSTFTLLGLGGGLSPLSPVTDIKENLPASPTMTVGSATAMVDFALVSGADVHPLTISSKVSGTADAPPESSSTAAALRGHLVEIDRTTSRGDPLPAVTLRFSFDIAWKTLLSVDMPFLESAGGGAYFAIAGFEDGFDELVMDAGMPGDMVIGLDGKKRWEFNPEYFTSMSDVDETFSGTVTGTITVFAGAVGAFSVITDAAGRADARPLPEPGVLLLLVAPLLMLVLRRR